MSHSSVRWLRGDPDARIVKNSVGRLVEGSNFRWVHARCGDRGNTGEILKLHRFDKLSHLSVLANFLTMKEFTPSADVVG